MRFFQRRPTVFVLAQVRTCIQKVREQEIDAHCKLDAIDVAPHRTGRRITELLDHRLDLGRGHHVRDHLRGGKNQAQAPVKAHFMGRPRKPETRRPRCPSWTSRGTSYSWVAPDIR